MKSFRPIIAILALALSWWSVACAKPVLFHPAVGAVTIQSATVNSAGTTLTLALSTTATVSSAAGMTVEFDNDASRTLTYSSGSGTSSLVFTFNAVSPSTDGRAPVGTVCTLDYDAGAGNIAGLADATNQAVTNNSTVIPEPDLPQGLPTAALPANWNAAADHSPANNAALQELLDGDGSGDVAAGDVISLDADVDYGTIVIDADIQGSAGNWIIIRSDEYTSLPTFSATDSSGRVTAGDETYMATISRTPSQENHSALNINGGANASGGSGPGAGYIRFIGINFKLYGSYSTDTLAIASTLLDGLASSLGNLPHHIGFDRCSFTHANTMKGVQDAVRFDTDDSFIVGCNFYNLWGAGNDGSNGTRVYNGHRILITNNRFHCNGASGFLGDNPLTVVEDYEFSRNYHFRDSDWDTGHGNTKGSFESKTGLRIAINENVFNYQFNLSGFGAITIKAEGTGGPKTCTHVTARGNKMTNVATAFVILVGGSSDDDDVGPNTDLLFEHNLAYGLARRGVQLKVYDHSGNMPMERLQMLNNTSPDAKGGFSIDGSDAGATPGQYFRMVDNIWNGEFNIYFLNGGANGANGLNFTWGSTYTVTHNLWVAQSTSNFDTDSSPAPSGTLTNSGFPANVAAIGFTNSGANDYSIDAGSTYVTSSSVGGKPGYDSATYDPIWVEVAQ